MSSNNQAEGAGSLKRKAEDDIEDSDAQMPSDRELAAAYVDYRYSEAARRAAQVPVPPQQPIAVYSAQFPWQQEQQPGQSQQSNAGEAKADGMPGQVDRTNVIDPALSSLRSSAGDDTTGTGAGAGNSSGIPPELTFTHDDSTLNSAGDGGDAQGDNGDDNDDILMGDATEALAQVAAAAAAQSHLQQHGQQQQHQQSGMHQSSQASQLPGQGQPSHSGASTPIGGQRNEYNNAQPGSALGEEPSSSSSAGYLGVPSDGQTPKKDLPFSRSPELRVSHKLAERKRRKEMKDLFDELRELLPPDRGAKASKWEILTKSIDYIQWLKTERADAQRNVERLQREVDIARGGTGTGVGLGATSTTGTAAGTYRMTGLPMSTAVPTFNNYIGDADLSAFTAQNQAQVQPQAQQPQQQQQQPPQQPQPQQQQMPVGVSQQQTQPQVAQAQTTAQQPSSGLQQGQSEAQPQGQEQGQGQAKQEQAPGQQVAGTEVNNAV